MQMIDRYELTIPGHMRLVDARSALNYLERFVEASEGPLDRDELAEKLEPLVEALNDASDDARPVSGEEAFELQACKWNYISLSADERDAVHLMRITNPEGRADIFRMIGEIQNSKPMPDPQ